MIEVRVGGTDTDFYEVNFAEPLPAELKNKIVLQGAYHLLNVLKNVE